MKVPRRVLALTVVGVALVAVTGCSIDGVLWSPDGARVIDTTEKLIAGASSGGQDSLSCEGSAAVFGEADVWDGLSAGEPEQFDPETSVDRPALDATWRINLEGAGLSGTSGEEVPTDVFYRETETGLCVADVIWQSVDVD
ncbi:hypothetical protein [Microbacterium sp. KR10-403]|uniref:hypothetical protein n=1 Tax=Microbacterium sp. KR10-403 TaxID=3158581 RepID=UPI0032E36ECB